MLIIGLAAGVAVSSADPGFPALSRSGAKNVQRRTLNETAAGLAGKTLKIDKTQAHLTITAWDRNDVSAEAVVEVGDGSDDVVREFLDNTKLTMTTEAGGAVLRLDSPLNWAEARREKLPRLGQLFRSRSWNLSFSAKIDVRVPASLSLDMANGFGDVVVRGVTGRLAITNESGKVHVETCGGSLDLTNSFGPVRIAAFKGAVKVGNESGAVELENIGGSAEVRNSFAEVSFKKIGGPLTVTSESAAVIGAGVAGDVRIRSSFDKIDVRDIRGRCDVTGESAAVTVELVDKDALLANSFQPLQATRIKGSLSVTGESSLVRAADIGGDAIVRSSFNPITLEKIHGRATVEAESSAVTLRDIDRDASVVTSYGAVEARRIGGGLKVKGESAAVLGEEIGGPVDIRNSFHQVILRKTAGSISIAGESSGIDVSQIRALPAGSQIDIKTSFMPIVLALPTGTPVQGTARTQYGKIVTGFPVYLLDGDEAGHKAVRFETGKNGVTLKLENTADITIKTP